MSAPSLTHERLVEDLDALAVLTGHRWPLQLPGSRPDVARVDHRRRAVFVADAKHSEAATNPATALRYDAYLRLLRRWWAAGYVVTAAVAHDSRSDRWTQFLFMRCDLAGLPVATTGTAVFAVDAVITWVRATPPRSIRPPPL